MLRPRLLHDHRHNRILVGAPPGLVRAHDLIQTHIAHKIPKDKHKVGRDNAVRVYVAQRLSRGKARWVRDDGRDSESGCWKRPF